MHVDIYRQRVQQDEYAPPSDEERSADRALGLTGEKIIALKRIKFRGRFSMTPDIPQEFDAFFDVRAGLFTVRAGEHSRAVAEAIVREAASYSYHPLVNFVAERARDESETSTWVTSQPEYFRGLLHRVAEKPFDARGADPVPPPLRLIYFMLWINVAALTSQVTELRSRFQSGSIVYFVHFDAAPWRASRERLVTLGADPGVLTSLEEFYHFIGRYEEVLGSLVRQEEFLDPRRRHNPLSLPAHTSSEFIAFREIGDKLAEHGPRLSERLAEAGRAGLDPST